MPLIKCPECNKQISDKAAACPDCGCPINADANEKGAITTTTIQITSKRWKSLQLAGGSLIIIGVIGSCSASADKSPPSPGDISVWPFIILAGLILLIYARFKAWWHHG